MQIYIVVIRIKLRFDFSRMFKFRSIHYAKQTSLFLNGFFFRLHDLPFRFFKVLNFFLDLTIFV